MRRAQDVLVAMEAKKLQAVDPRLLREAEQQANEKARIYDQRSEEEFALE